MSSRSSAPTGEAGPSFSVEFFDLQLRFASRVAELSGQPLAETIGRYTNLFVRLAMGRRLDPTNVDWQRYLSQLMAAPEPAVWTHAVHRRRRALHAGPTPARTEGCFSYERVGTDRVRLHFHARAAESSLSPTCCVERMGELRNLSAHLKAASSGEMQVIGASWLYNLAGYRRLFPERYLVSLKAIDHPYQRLPLWGQFVARDGSVRPAARQRFLADIAKAASVAELAACFPMSVLSTVAPAAWFYDEMGW